MTTQTSQLNPEVVNQLNELQGRAANLVNTFGQLYVRRKILREEYETLEQLEKESDTAYVDANKEINSILETLRTEYKNGSIDLQAGTVTYVIEDQEDGDIQ